MEIPGTMKAVVYRGRDRVRVETVPVPRIGPGELLVRVESCGVCGTDLKKIHYATVTPPRIFGHEISGTVVRVGPRTRRWSVGDRVAVFHHVACKKCFYCRRGVFARCPLFLKTGITAGFEPAGGGFAQFLRVMPWVVERGVVKIPRGISFDEACMLEPVNTVLKAIETLATRRGDWLIVFGQGPIGLKFTQLARLRGAKVVAVDLLDARLAVAKKFGAVAGVNASAKNFVGRIHEVTGRCGADAAVVAVPSAKAIQQAITVTRTGGKILLFAHTQRGDAVPIDAGAICVDEKQLLGSYSASPRCQSKAARLIFQRKINVRDMITHRFPLEQIAEAIKLASNPTARSLKIIVKPNANLSP